MTALFVFDFDGTLAYRPGLWSGCLHGLLDEHDPGHTIELDAIKQGLRDGFPWHRPEVAHLELADPEAWWAALHPVLERAYVAAGVHAELARRLARLVRGRYCDPSGFILFDDTVGALESVRAAGARSVILSNHTPELRAIVDHLGLDALVDTVLTSAAMGYEKPHPEAFRLALGTVDPTEAVMIGDNPVADVEGGRAAGMRAALVRHADARYATVAEAVEAALTGELESGSAPGQLKT